MKISNLNLGGCLKKKEKKKEHNKLAHDLKLERFCLLSFLLTAFLIR